MHDIIGGIRIPMGIRIWRGRGLRRGGGWWRRRWISRRLSR